MRIATVAGLTGLALISLAACNRNPSGAASAASGAQTASAAAPAPAASPAFPHRRAGLWEEKINVDGTSFVSASQMCIDDALQAKMGFLMQSARSKCSTFNMNHQLDGSWTFNSTCVTAEGGTTTTTGTVHGDFDSGYTMNADTVTTGSSDAQMNRETKMTMQSTWLGPCKPDQKPGDVMVNGMKMNMAGAMAGSDSSAGSN
jgi:hypothetical protein